MIHPGCIGSSNSQSMAMTTRLSIPMSQKPTIAGSSHLPMTMTFSCLRSFHGAMTFPRVRRLGAAHNQLNLFPPTGVCCQHISAASSPLLVGDHDVFSGFMPSIPKRHPKNMFVSPKASKDVPSSFRYPPMTKKPRWWWRTLACLPYLMPLHETWMYAETAYHLHPFLEDFEFFTYPFLGAIGRLPSWFLMAYFFAAYLGIVRRKEWPHFFRFHVVMGMLLEIALQVVGMVSRWMPLAFYWGKIGMHFWTAVAFGYLFTVLESIKCALCGMYADIPFVCDAAYIQIPYD